MAGRGLGFVLFRSRNLTAVHAIAEITVRKLSVALCVCVCVCVCPCVRVSVCVCPCVCVCVSE